jgi:hypothetical protein
VDSSFAQGSDRGIVVSELAITVPGVAGAARRRPIVQAVTVEASLSTIDMILRERLPVLLAEKDVEGELVGIKAGDNALLITVRLRHPRLKLPFGSAIPIEPTIAVVPTVVQGVLQIGIEIRELGGQRLPFVVDVLNFRLSVSSTPPSDPVSSSIRRASGCSMWISARCWVQHRCRSRGRRGPCSPASIRNRSTCASSAPGSHAGPESWREASSGMVGHGNASCRAARAVAPLDTASV